MQWSKNVANCAIQKLLHCLAYNTYILFCFSSNTVTSVFGFAVFVQPHHYITQIFLRYIYIRLKIFFTVCKNIATIQEKAKPESICQHHKWDPVRQLQLEINDPVILGYVYRILYNKEDIEICFLGYCQCAFWNLLKLE